jgi:hypothetical protein
MRAASEIGRRGELLEPDDAGGQASQDHGIYDHRAELFHEVQSQAALAPAGHHVVMGSPHERFMVA